MNNYTTTLNGEQEQQSQETKKRNTRKVNKDDVEQLSKELLDADDYKIFTQTFLKKHNIIKVGATFFICVDRCWKMIDEKTLRDFALGLHPKDTIKNRSEIVSMAGAMRMRQEMPLWDQVIQPHEIVFKDCIVDIYSGKTRAIKDEDFVTTVLPHKYDPTAECPRWKQCLDEWLDSEDKKLALQEFFGYTLSGHTKFKKALLLYGESNTGKSVPLNVAEFIVGDKNTCSVDPRDMKSPSVLAELYGKKLNIEHELSEASKLCDCFRKLIDNGHISINPKYVARCTIHPSCKHMFATNILPKMEVDEKANRANIERLLLITFNKTIDNRDNNLLVKLKAEVNGIINWAIEGLKRLLKVGAFTEVDNKKDFEEYKTANYDELTYFIKTSGMFEFSNDFEITSDEFINKFYTFLGEKGPQLWNKISIGKRMNQLGYKPYQKGGKSRFYKGLRVVNDAKVKKDNTTSNTQQQSTIN